MKPALVTILALLLFACSDGPRPPGVTEGRWLEGEPMRHPVLRGNVGIITWWPDVEIDHITPIRSLRVDGHDIEVRSVETSRPHLVPIETAELALAYAELIRYFDTSMALVPAAPDYGFVVGVELVLPILAEDGVGLEPKVEEVPDRFEITRPWIRTGARPRAFLRREKIGRDGSYVAHELETLVTGERAWARYEAFSGR